MTSKNQNHTDKLLSKKGYYSGNFRLDTSECQEPKADDETSKEKWLGKGRKIRIKRKLKRWESNISPTIPPEELTVHLVGQSHIDIAWKWREEQTRKKAQVTYNKALVHSSLFPEKFCFALSQPLLLEWIKEDNPYLFKKIQDTVKSENIELVGGSYVEPDAMMPSAEAMIRQRLYGMRFYHENFDNLPKVEWFLDSFGYNYGLPQILVKSGAKYFYTSKLTWNRDTVFPFVHFLWKSPDGSTLLSANFHYDPQVLETWQTYQVGRYVLKKDGKKQWSYKQDYSQLDEHIDQDNICPHVGYFFGQSDGGHGPTHKEVAEANTLATLSWFRWSNIHKYFKSLSKYKDSFPIWEDELYLEIHRGCFSSHAQVKRMNRKFENLLPTLESLLSLLLVFDSELQIPVEKLEFVWKVLLKNQFHDILPGSSIPEVYDDCWEDWNNQNKICTQIIEEIGRKISSEPVEPLSQKKAMFLLFNSLSWERSSRIFIPISIFQDNLELLQSKKLPYAKLILNNYKEREYLCQPKSADPESAIDPKPAGWWTVLKLKPLSINVATLQLLDKDEQEKIHSKNFEFGKPIVITQNSISNGIITIDIDKENGSIQRLLHTELNEGNNLIEGTESNLLYCYLDRTPLQHHAWNLTPDYWNHQYTFSNNKNVVISIEEKGPIFSSLKITKAFGNSPVSQTISLFKECPEIYFDFSSNWHQEDSMLKIKYCPTTKSNEVIADGMACVIVSKINPKSPSDKARFEKICHKYFDLSTPKKEWGIALLNEGKYAFDVLDGKMSLTLLRACRYPETAPEAWVNKERELNLMKYDHKVPKYSGLGNFTCRYALFPHKGGALQNSDSSINYIVKRKAEEFNIPALIIPINTPDSKFDTHLIDNPICTISPNNVILSILKLNEWKRNNDIIIRFQEICGDPTKSEVTFTPLLAQKIIAIKTVDFLEREEKRPFLWNKKEGSLLFNMGKFELSTFKLEISF
ncbi:MAG: hypothetical protein GF311_11725 [Candidatus Lokiarchaeota archaeon]|nr:hypothetical protein [Candidatus Lokiarchaeota archaeon]